MITITTFKWVPTFAQGYVKDHRLRWACEEAQLAYSLKLVDRDETTTDAYRQQQPFGQVPVLQDGDVTIFESGAIVLHLAEKSEKLMPKDISGRTRTLSWVFAALNSVEPFVLRFNVLGNEGSNDPSIEKQKSAALEILQKRFQSLDIWLKGKEYLEKDFTVGDIMMTTVLRNLDDKNIFKNYSNLNNYFQHCEKRPAFQKAIADQMKTFADNTPKA